MDGPVNRANDLSHNGAMYFNSANDFTRRPVDWHVNLLNALFGWPGDLHFANNFAWCTHHFYMLDNLTGRSLDFNALDNFSAGPWDLHAANNLPCGHLDRNTANKLARGPGDFNSTNDLTRWARNLHTTNNLARGAGDLDSANNLAGGTLHRNPLNLLSALHLHTLNDLARRPLHSPLNGWAGNNLRDDMLPCRNANNKILDASILEGLPSLGGNLLLL